MKSIRSAATVADPSAATWSVIPGKLKGYACLINGREWGSVIKGSSRELGPGWSSTLAGFFKDLEQAQHAHQEAIAKQLAAPRAEPRERPYNEGISADQWCRERGKLFVDPRMQRIRNLEQKRLSPPPNERHVSHFADASPAP